jgi:hypothetical protein
MASTPPGDQIGPEEIRERLRKILRGAFSGPPTSLKNIPKKRADPQKRKNTNGTPEASS